MIGPTKQKCRMYGRIWKKNMKKVGDYWQLSAYKKDNEK